MSFYIFLIFFIYFLAAICCCENQKKSTFFCRKPYMKYDGDEPFKKVKALRGVLMIEMVKTVKLMV